MNSIIHHGIIKFSISLCCFIFLISCQSHTPSSGDQLLDMFEHTIPLSATLWMDYSSIPAAGFAMGIIDSIIIMREGTDKYHFQLINLHNKSLIRKFGRKGRGPGESQRSHIIMQSWHHGNLKTLQSDNIYAYSIDSLVNFENYLPVPLNLKENANFFNFFKVTEIRPETFIGIGTFVDGLYGVIHDGEFIGSFIDYPIKEQYKNIPRSLLGIAYQGMIESHPDGEKCVVTFYDGGIIHFLDTKNNIPVISKEIVTVVPDLRLLTFGEGRSLTVTKDTQRGFPSLATTDSYVYALYSGKSRDNPEYLYGNNLLVFSWDGEPIINFTLDVGINCMFVDSDNQYAYGTNFYGDMVKFPIYMDSRN